MHPLCVCSGGVEGGVHGDRARSRGGTGGTRGGVHLWMDVEASHHEMQIVMHPKMCTNNPSGMQAHNINDTYEPMQRLVACWQAKEAQADFQPSWNISGIFRKKYGIFGNKLATAISEYAPASGSWVTSATSSCLTQTTLTSTLEPRKGFFSR